MVQDTTTSKTAPRLHGLDALRAGALLLGIVLHSLMPFATGISWLVDDIHTATTPLLLIAVIHLFRMVVFMLLAGWFGAMVLQRRGPGSYLRDRLKRIALPLVVFWPVAVLPLGLLAGLQLSRTGGPALPAADGTEFPTEGPQQLLYAFTPGQLWFLLTLIECVLITLGLRWLLRRMIGGDRAEALRTRAGRLLARPGGVLLAALPYLLCLLLQGTTAGGIIAPPTVLPSVALIAYLGAFWVGWALFGDPDALGRIAGQWPAHLVAAVVLTVGVLTLPEALIGLPAAAAVNALAGWSWAYALLGICVRFLHAERPWIRYLADASYWMYLMHLPLLVGFEMMIFDRPWPIIVKLLLTWLFVTAVLLGSYAVAVRHTWLGRWLNGHRTRERTGAGSAPVRR